MVVENIHGNVDNVEESLKGKNLHDNKESKGINAEEVQGKLMTCTLRDEETAPELEQEGNLTHAHVAKKLTPTAMTTKGPPTGNTPTPAGAVLNEEVRAVECVENSLGGYDETRGKIHAVRNVTNWK